MKISAAILGLALPALLLYWWFVSGPDPRLQRPRSDLPWQIEVLPNGGARVFDLQLGTATLADAVAKFGPFEDMAVFAGADRRPVLEVYFGTVQFGPVSAKVVVTLALPAARMEQLVGRAIKREGSSIGDWKYKLGAADQAAQRDRRLLSITYIPTYGGLDAEFFRRRLGGPPAWRDLDEHAVQWFYPERGLSVVIDPDGKEVLEYVAPRDFRLPDGVARRPATP